VILNSRYAVPDPKSDPAGSKAPFCDGVSGLRYYNPTQGRWLNRDPIDERGGLNLCAFCNNNPVGLYDFIGLKLTPYTTDISTLTFSEGDCDDNGRTAPIWGEIVAKPDGNKVIISGNIVIRLAIRAGRDPNKIGSDNRKISTGDHEREHGQIAKTFWNTKSESVNKWEGEYCSENCAKYAVMIANAQNIVNRLEMQIAEEQMDVTYTDNEDQAARMESDKNEKESMEKFLQVALKNYEKLGCAKTK
jgi:uncharacterized protein RhaS with RHS repeats